MVRVDSLDHLVVFTNTRSGYGNVGLEFQPPVRMPFFQVKEHLLNVATGVAHRNIRRNTHVEKQVGFFRSTAGPPGMAATNAAKIHDAFPAAIRSLLFPHANPFQDLVHQLVHAPNGVHLLAPLAKCSVHVDAGAGNTYPERSEMLKHYVHIRGLTQDAHIGEHSVIYQVVCAHPVTAILFSLELAPLCLLDLSGNGRNDHITPKLDFRALQGLDRVGVADQRPFHVVNAQAIEKSIFDDGLWLVSDASQEFFVASVGSVHVAVEHQALAATNSHPAPNHVGASLFYFLPCDIQPELVQRRLHVLRHLKFFAGWAWNVYDIAAHGNDFFFVYLGENFLRDLGIH